jgi:hypothetical protein
MVDLTPALRGLAWQYAVDRIDLPELERRIERLLAHQQRVLDAYDDDDAPLVTVIRGGRCPSVPA